MIGYYALVSISLECFLLQQDTIVIFHIRHLRLPGFFSLFWRGLHKVVYKKAPYGGPLTTESITSTVTNPKTPTPLSFTVSGMLIWGGLWHRSLR